MTTVVRRRTTAGGVVAKFLQFLALQQEEGALKERREDLKKELIEHAEAHHEVDPEKGHLIHTLPEPIEMGGKQYSGFMKQRKVSQSFDADKAQALCEEKGFEKDDYITVEEYVDQDKIVRLYAEDKITDEEFAALLPESESWAFVPVKS